MRHKKAKGILDRKKSPRVALINGLMESLILHEKINTTEAKAKILKSSVEKLITIGKTDSVVNRRKAMKSLKTEVAVKKLFELGKQFKDRSGGYTRLSKIGNRKGDNAPTVRIEFVSQNENEK